VARYLFSSHDGYGLGHVRRNVLVAREILRRDPSAEVTLVTGVPRRPSWLDQPGLEIVAVPPLLKGSDGSYRNAQMSIHHAIAERARVFSDTVRRVEPDVVVVDRHPFGTAGELRTGLQVARRSGALVVLGLRDIIDEQAVVRQELASAGWHGVPGIFDEILVYGDPALCDQQAEYGLPMRPDYCGWVVESLPAAGTDENLVVVSAGGGADGAAVFQLGLGVVQLRPHLRAVIAAGPFAGDWGSAALAADPELASRVRLATDGGATGELLVRAGATVQMAGYNSTVESLAAGLRPVLVPRRTPRREQAIRAARLACLGLADMVDESASPAEVAWLLDQPRRLAPGACERAGISFDGAANAAARLTADVAVQAA